MVPGSPTQNAGPGYTCTLPQALALFRLPFLEYPGSRWVWLLGLAETALLHRLLTAKPSPSQGFSSQTQLLAVLPCVPGRAFSLAGLCLLRGLARSSSSQLLVSAPLCPACHPTASLRVPEMGGVGLVYFCRNRWVPITQAPILVRCLQSLILAYDEYLVGEEQQEGMESFAPSSF